jgi:uncharacterized protein (UPF0332 family)
VIDRSAKRLEQSERAIAAARRDLAAGDADQAIDRSYYAMFYAADALLAAHDLAFSSHGAVHGAFGKQFAKTGALDPKFHRWLLGAYDERQKSTYGLSAEFTEERAQQLIDQAEDFLAAAREHLASRG